MVQGSRVAGKEGRHDRVEDSTQWRTKNKVEDPIQNLAELLILYVEREIHRI